MKLKTKVHIDPDYFVHHTFSCHDPQIKPKTIYFKELEYAKIIYIRCSTVKTSDGKLKSRLVTDIIPRNTEKVKKLLGNKSGSKLWVGEKLRIPEKDLWSELAGLESLETSEVVKIKYYNHGSRDTRTLYEVFVWNGNSPTPPPNAKLYTGTWNEVFGASRGWKIPFFQDLQNCNANNSQRLQIVPTQELFSFLQWHRHLLF